MSAVSASALAAALVAAVVYAVGPRTRSTRRPVPDGADGPDGPDRADRTRSGQHVFARSVASAAARRLRRLFGRRRRPPVAADGVANWCDALGRRLRSGDSLRHALLTELPPDPVLRTRTDALRRAIEHGASAAAAVGASGEAPHGLREPSSGRHPHWRGTRPRDRHLELALSVIAVSADVGGGAATPLDRTAAALRLRSVDAQERAAQSAQAKLSAHVLTVVPVGLLLLLVATDDDVRAIVGSGLGAMLVGFGLALNLIGWSWMRHTIDGNAA